MNSLKKAGAALAIITMMGFGATAQKIDAAKVPAAVKAGFEKKFPGVTGVKWEKEKGKFEAGFKQNNQNMSALFEANGTMAESEVSIAESALPAPVLAYVKKNHPGVKIKEAAKITKANGEVNYEAEVKGKDLLFDSKGTFIKAVKD